MNPQQNQCNSQLSQTDSQIFNRQVDEYKNYHKNRQSEEYKNYHNNRTGQQIQNQQDISSQQNISRVSSQLINSQIQNSLVHSVVQEEEFFDIINQQEEIPRPQYRVLINYLTCFFYKETQTCPFCLNSIRTVIMLEHLNECDPYDKFVCQYCAKKFKLEFKRTHESNCEMKTIIEQQALQLQLEMDNNQANENSNIQENHSIQRQESSDDIQILEQIIYPVAENIVEFVIDQVNSVSINDFFNSINNFFMVDQDSNNEVRQPQRQQPQQQQPQQQQLKSFIFQASPDQRTTSSNCIICQNDYIRQDKVMRLGCGHIYHSHCIRQWLRTKLECPVCKARVQLN